MKKLLFLSLFLSIAIGGYSQEKTKKKSQQSIPVSIITLILLILFGCQCMFAQIRLSEHISNHSIIDNPQNIHRQPVRFRVLNSQDDTLIVNTSIQSFSLADDQTYATFKTNQVFLNISELPEDAIILPEASFSRSTNNEDYLHQVYLSELSPFIFDPETKSFHGKIEIHTVQGSMGGQAETQRSQIDLVDPFEMIITAVGITEKTIMIESLNWPPITVDFNFIASENPLRDSVNIIVKTIQNPEGYVTPLSIIPYIEISVEKEQIQGLGIQETPVHVSLRGVSNYPELTVGMQTSKGYFDPDEITIKANQVYTVSLRSEGTGHARISVEAANLVSTSDIIYFGFPWKFLLFSIAGAIIGSLIHVFRKRDTGFDTRAFVVGILLGFTVSVCYWALGVNLLSITIEVSYLNEFAVFALSILGALLGWHLGRMKETT